MAVDPACVLDCCSVIRTATLSNERTRKVLRGNVMPSRRTTATCRDLRETSDIDDGHVRRFGLEPASRRFYRPAGPISQAVMYEDCLTCVGVCREV